MWTPEGRTKSVHNKVICFNLAQIMAQDPKSAKTLILHSTHLHNVSFFFFFFSTLIFKDGEVRVAVVIR